MADGTYCAAPGPGVGNATVNIPGPGPNASFNAAPAPNPNGRINLPGPSNAANGTVNLAQGQTINPRNLPHILPDGTVELPAIPQDGCPTIRVFNEIPPYIDTNAPPLRTPERQRFEPSCSPPIAGYPGRYQSGAPAQPNRYIQSIGASGGSGGLYAAPGSTPLGCRNTQTSHVRRLNFGENGSFQQSQQYSSSSPSGQSSASSGSCSRRQQLPGAGPITQSSLPLPNPPYRPDSAYSALGVQNARQAQLMQQFMNEYDVVGSDEIRPCNRDRTF